TCRGNPPPDEADLHLLRDVFQQMSGPLRRTMELQSIRDRALALQQSFLTPPQTLDGLTITALYHPADSAAEIGGDWYDAVRLSEDALALSIGDIAGHDLDAATAMGRVNSLLRGLAYDSGPTANPATTLSRLDRIVQALDGPSMITVIHALIRPQTPHIWRVTLSNAGHPPPLLIPHDAPPRYLHDLTAPDPPLCVTDTLTRTTFDAPLREGDTLVLYTDGLVETPDTDIGDDLRRLREHTHVLVGRGLPLAILIRGLLPSVQYRRDDIAVIALQAGRRPAEAR
ncbi:MULTISPECIES: PP2C family protein-serine/threonine phosphatase, partial [unclassified Streptomyces]|uniref:PP2C family protein-serine/threonine phosphatase n=1 Tax=unclassified Streptomyces TaxID=2593676 RepID=UPI000823808D